MSLKGGLELGVLSLRRLVADKATPLSLAAIVAVVSFGMTALPRAVATASDEAVQFAIGAAAPVNRHLIFDQDGRVAPGAIADPLSQVVSRGEELAASIPDPLPRAIEATSYLVHSPTFEVRDFPVDSRPFPNRYFSFRTVEGIDAHVRMVDGRMPSRQTTSIEEEQDGRSVVLPIFETAITTETATWMRIEIGDRVRLNEWRDSPRNNSVPLGQLSYEAVLEVVGIVEVEDPNADFWLGDNSLAQPGLVQTLDGTEVFAAGLFDPADFLALAQLTSPSPWYFQWRHFVDPSVVDAQSLAEIDLALSELDLQYQRRAGSNVVRVRSGLDSIYDSFRSQRFLSITLLALALAASAGLALAVALLLGSVTAAQKKRATVLARARGGSPEQVMLGQIVENAVIVVPAAVVGVLGGNLVPGRSGGSGVLVLVVATIGFLVAASMPTWPLARAGLGVLLSGREGPVRGFRRLVLELAIVGMAVSGLILLRRRGLNPTAESVDPLMAAVPTLVGLATGIVAARLYPGIASRISRLVGRGRGVTWLVGLRRVEMQAPVTRVPVVLVSVAVSVALLGVILSDTISRAQQEEALYSVGADYRLEPTLRDSGLSTLIDLDPVDGVEADATISVLEGRLTGRDFVLGPVSLVAADADLLDVLDEVPGELSVDRDLLTHHPDRTGTESAPIPLLVSRDWLGGREVAVGDIFEMRMGRGSSAFFDVAQVATRLPGIPRGQPFGLVARSSLAALERQPPLQPTALLIKAPPEIGPDLTALISEQSPNTRVVSRERNLARYRDAPLARATASGWAVSGWFGAALAALAAMAGLALTTPDRSRDLGYLRTLGASSRQAFRVAAAEQLPPVLIGVLAGVLTGLGVSWLILPGIDLEPYTGSTGGVSLVVDYQRVALIAGAVLAVLTAGILLFSLTTRKINLGNLLRIGGRQ